MEHLIAEQYPFRCLLSLKPLIDHFDGIHIHAPGAECALEPSFRHKLKQTPELLEPIADLEIIERHRPMVHRLMSLLFPPVYWDTQAFAALVPFTTQPFFSSPKFQSMFVDHQGCLQVWRNIDEKSFEQGRAIKAFLLILDKYYDIHQSLDYPLVCAAPDPETGLERYFAYQMDFRFVDVEPVAELPTLDQDQRRQIQENMTRPEVLSRILPPEKFQITGFTVVHAVDVTETEVISFIERDLIDQHTIVSKEGFAHLQKRLQTFFRRPDLAASLACIQDEQVLLLNMGVEIKKSCIFRDSLQVPLDTFKNTIYRRALESDEIILVSDYRQEPGLKPLRAELEEAEARSLMIAPLHVQGKCIGTLTVKTSRPGDLGPMDTLLFRQLQPVFSMAVNKVLHDLDAQIQSIIKQECTAIHPLVEWRFRQAALNLLEKRRLGQNAELEPIVFPEVYPLYGATDVRGSSEERNRAVAADLAHHLELALAVVEAAGCTCQLPILEELAGRIQSLGRRLQGGLATGDETLVVNFLKREVESIFDDLSGLDPAVNKAIENYRREVDPNLGTVYRARREFEKSVYQPNERLASYLDAEENWAQGSFPHYFERHRTDGVDYIIYQGASLMEKGGFNKLHLKSMRLWQIMVACGLAWHNQDLKSELPIPLDTAHLILVQNHPLAIRFRYDEKRFDVAGAYDIRYEIIRSRLDKAVVAGTGQRLTQPGKVAIVYTSQAEALEMKRHIEFLQGRGFLTGELERLELEDLPGVQGLRALRIEVDLDSPALAERAQGMLEKYGKS